MSKFKFSILLLFLVINNISSKLNKEKVVLAINCGGDEYTDEDEVVYQKVK